MKSLLVRWQNNAEIIYKRRGRIVPIKNFRGQWQEIESNFVQTISGNKDNRALVVVSQQNLLRHLQAKYNREGLNSYWISLESLAKKIFQEKFPERKIINSSSAFASILASKFNLLNYNKVLKLKLQVLAKGPTSDDPSLLLYQQILDKYSLADYLDIWQIDITITKWLQQYSHFYFYETSQLDSLQKLFLEKLTLLFSHSVCWEYVPPVISSTEWKCYREKNDYSLAKVLCQLVANHLDSGQSLSEILVVADSSYQPLIKSYLTKLKILPQTLAKHPDSGLRILLQVIQSELDTTQVRKLIYHPNFHFSAHRFIGDCKPALWSWTLQRFNVHRGWRQWLGILENVLAERLSEPVETQNGITSEELISACQSLQYFAYRCYAFVEYIKTIQTYQAWGKVFTFFAQGMLNISVQNFLTIHQQMVLLDRLEVPYSYEQAILYALTTLENCPQVSLSLLESSLFSESWDSSIGLQYKTIIFYRPNTEKKWQKFFPEPGRKIILELEQDSFFFEQRENIANSTNEAPAISIWQWKEELTWWKNSSGGMTQLHPIASKAYKENKLRWETFTFSHHNGIMDEKSSQQKDSANYTPKHLETYALCPYQYLLKYVWKVFPWFRTKVFSHIPEHLLRRMFVGFVSQLHYLEDGDFHSVMEQRNSYIQKRSFSPELIWETDKKFLEILYKQADQYLLEGFSEQFQVPFQLDIPLPNGKKCCITGKMDQISITPNEVISRNYRRKKWENLRNDHFYSGEFLALGFYLAILKRMYPNLQCYSAHQVYLSGGDDSTFISDRNWKDKWQYLQWVSQKIISGVEGGKFFPAAGNSKCGNCNYSGVCGVLKMKELEQKSDCLDLMKYLDWKNDLGGGNFRNRTRQESNLQPPVS